MRECKTFCGLAQNAHGVYPWDGSKIPGFYWLTQLALSSCFVFLLRHLTSYKDFVLHFALLQSALKKLLHFALESYYILR